MTIGFQLALAGGCLAGLMCVAAPAHAQIQLGTSNVPLASLAAGSAQGPIFNRFTLSAELVVGTVGSRTQRFSNTKPSMFDTLIGEHAGRNALRPELVRAVVQTESGFNPNARSPKGALGLMQLMPATARQFGVTNAFDPEQNIRAGSAYLRQLLDRYDNDEELALAAYNAGPGAVDKYGQTIPPYRETKHYVAKVSELAGEGTRVTGTPIYKVTEIENGREVITYTNRKSR